MNKIINIDDLVSRVDEEPALNFIWQGIKEKTMNFIVAPSKVGKTTLCENLGMSIAAGCQQYMNSTLWFGDNKRVLIIGLEEFYVNRTSRNKKQLTYLDEKTGNSTWHSNYNVVTPDAPRYIQSKKDWKWITDAIESVSPRITVIDSLTRLHAGSSIEDSTVCIDLTKKLRKIEEKTGTTLIVIHHTHKIKSEPLSLSNMAGSRILAQEADAIIALNKTPLGKRYIKPLAYRYADDYCETVQTFIINENGWLVPGQQVNEGNLLREFDNRTDTTNKDLVLQYFFETSEGNSSKTIEAKELVDEFVVNGTMTKPTLYSAINVLVEDKKIKKVNKGVYNFIHS